MKRDLDLIQLIREGNEQAFKNLFDNHYGSMCITANRMVKDEHKARDFAQDVFLNIWKRKTDLKINSSVSGYLHRAVRNKCIDYLRNNRIAFDEDLIWHTEKYEDVKHLELIELKSALNKEIDQLPEKCRIVFKMSREEELSHKEIALKLGISKKTIENQITKALKRLRIVVESYKKEENI